MEKSIRDLILGIKSLKQPTKNLFLSVSNGHKNKAVTILTVFPNMEEEGAIRTSTLLPLLSHFYPAERVSKYFTPDEVERCKDCYWGVRTQQVTSPIDAAINKLAEIELIDPEYIFELPPADLQGIGSEDISLVVAPAIYFESQPCDQAEARAADAPCLTADAVKAEAHQTEETEEEAEEQYEGQHTAYQDRP
jgi:hypothetical protein